MTRAALLFAVLMALGAFALAAPPDRAAALPGPVDAVCAVPGVSAACAAVGAVGDAVDSVASAGVDALLGGVRDSIASGLGWFLERLLTAADQTTTPRFDGYVAEHSRAMAQAGGLFVVPFVILAIAQALMRGNAVAIVRVLGVYLPAAAILTGLIGVATTGLVQVTDAISANQAEGLRTDLEALQRSLPDALGAAGVPVLMAIIAGALMLAAGLLVWVELIVRDAAIQLIVVFMPLFFTGLVWPVTQAWTKRLVELLAALIISKLVIIETLALGIAAITSGDGLESVLAGAAMFLMAAITPLVVLSLMPLAIDAANLHRGRMGATWQGAPGVARSGGRTAWGAVSARIQGARPVPVRPLSGSSVRPGNPRIPIGG